MPGWQQAGSGAARESGFTLIELLIVIIIIAVLATIAIPTFLGQRQNAQDSATVRVVRDALTVVESANIDHMDYTAVTLAELSAIEPAITWQLKGENLVDPLGDPVVTAAVDAPAEENTVDFYPESATKYDLAAVSESGNRYGIEVVTTGSAGASYVKVRVADGDSQIGW
ncbi:MAG: hypothetical protein Kow00129_07360 [Thermoleophilia bacterium]